jgi:hypothetical protein
MSILEQSTSLYGQQFKKTVTDNFQYEGINEGWGSTYEGKVGSYFLGYNLDVAGEEVIAITKNYIKLEIYIPSNFTITGATITFIHNPIYWDEPGTYTVWGYCRKIKAYKVTNNNFLIYSAYLSEYQIDGGYTTSEIYGAFGDSGYTPSVPSDTSYINETTVSNDISAHLVIGNNIIIIQSGDTTPVLTGVFATDAANCGAKTGYARAIANIFGYYS